MFCTYCGQTNGEDARFCQRCGAPFAATTNRLAQPPITFAPPPPGSEAPPEPSGPIDPSTQETDPKAIASLVSSLVFFFFPLSQIAAVVLGHLSRADIRRSGGRKKGEGMALAGLIIGYAQIAAIPIILIVAAIAIPSLLRAKQAANEASAIQNVRRIVAAENTVHSEKNAYTCDANDFSDTQARDAVNGTPRNGYRYEMLGCSEGAFQVLATPANDQRGSRTFCADQSGEIKSIGGRVDAATCMENGQTVQHGGAARQRAAVGW
jgi:type II secretory pathway pseudopilin PulG